MLGSPDIACGSLTLFCPDSQDWIILLLRARFGQLFKNDLWVFYTKIITKLILNVAHHGWEKMKTFQSRSPKTTLNCIFSPFYLWKKLSLHLVPEDFCRKRIVWKNCPKIICIYFWLNSGCMQKQYVCAFTNTCKSNFYFYQQETTLL